MIKKLLLSVMILSSSQLIYAAAPQPITAPFNSTYSADQQSILNASEDWQQAIDARNPKAIAKLYDSNAYFYPTFSTQVVGSKALYQYFVNLTQKPQLQVIFDQENPRVYGNGTVGVNSGIYTFSYQDAHKKTVKMQARYTFIYLKENGTWMIIEHHSSVDPQQKKAAKPKKATKKSHKKSAT